MTARASLSSSVADEAGKSTPRHPASSAPIHDDLTAPHRASGLAPCDERGHPTDSSPLRDAEGAESGTAAPPHHNPAASRRATKAPRRPDITDALARLLRERHVGQARAATADTLIAELVADGVQRAHHRRLNDAVRCLRREGLAVVSTSGSATTVRGYCIAETPEEVAMFVGETRGRIFELWASLKAVDRASAESILHQMRLPEGGAEEATA